MSPKQGEMDEEAGTSVYYNVDDTSRSWKCSRGVALVAGLGLVGVVASMIVVMSLHKSSADTDGKNTMMLTDGDYYANIDPNSPTFKEDLQKLISSHTVLSYDGVWAAFADIDGLLPCKGVHTGKIGDVYSDKCWNAQGEKCGNYHGEGDCFNREHGWPKSWWGGFSKGHNAQTDLYLLWPADGYVNSLRGNHPLGYVDHPKYTSSNGAKLGPCSAKTGYDGTCFELPDDYKGDFARSYFYIATAYEGKFDCCDKEGVDGSNIKPWMEAVLREWHELDPVCDSERKLNDLIHEQFQHNRSPFIDHPEWVALIKDF